LLVFHLILALAFNFLSVDPDLGLFLSSIGVGFYLSLS
jgi:hypothetical protein